MKYRWMGGRYWHDYSGRDDIFVETDEALAELSMIVERIEKRLDAIEKAMALDQAAGIGARSFWGSEP